jgi:hypothetical protein
MDIILAVCAIVVALSAVATVIVLLTKRPTLGDRVERATRPPVELKRECRNCKHFDLEEGQHAINSHPAFVRAAQHLPPSAMGLNVTYKDCPDCIRPDMSDDERAQQKREAIESEPEDRCGTCGGSGTIRIEPKSELPLRARWDQFGSCTNPDLPEGDLRWNQDVCDHFEPIEHDGDPV